MRRLTRGQVLTMTTPKMHPDEIDIDTELVRRLLSSQAGQWAAQPVSPVRSHGTDNALFRIGVDKVVRLPRVAWAARLIEKEYRWLPRLPARLPLAVPHPLMMGEPAEGYPWSWAVYGWIEGDEAAEGELADPLEGAVTLARFIACLHEVDPADGPRAGPGNFHRGVPLAQRDASVREAIAALGPAIDRRPVVEAWERALAARGHRGAPTVLHGDLRPGNLLSRHGRLCAVIDFGCLGVGDPACDLQVAWSFFSGKARETFFSELSVDAAGWERGRGWALSVSLIALPYYRDRNPVLASIARHTIDEVLGSR